MEKVHHLYPENELLIRVQDGDRIAFELIYSSYVSKLYLYAYNILRDGELCRDIVQDIFVDLWLRRETANIKNLNNYLFTAVRFSVLTAIKRNSRKQILEVGELERLAGITLPTEPDMTEIEHLLEAGIAALPEKCRQVFIMSRKEYLSNKEIAERLNIASKTVESHMTMALQRLRVTLGDFLFWLCLLMPFWLLHVRL